MRGKLAIRVCASNSMRQTPTTESVLPGSTAVAASDVELIKVEDADFEAYIAKNPQRLLQMMRQLSERTRDLTMDYNEALYTVSMIRGQKEKDSGLMARIAKFAKIWKSSGK